MKMVVLDCFKKGLLQAGVASSRGCFKQGLLQAVVGVAGFEPAVSRPPAERSTRLSHTPMLYIDANLGKSAPKSK